MLLSVIAGLPCLAGRRIAGGLIDRLLAPGFITPDRAEPLLVPLLLGVVLALLIVVVRQRRALHRLQQPSPPADGLADARASRSHEPVTHAWLVSSIAAARAAMADLAASPDFASFDRIIGLGPALARLEQASDPAPSKVLASELRDGLAQAGWLHRIFRAELLLEAMSAPGSGWSSLGRALAAIGSAARAELATVGVEVVRPCLLAPVQRGHEVASEGLSDLRHVAFLNRAVRAAVSGISEPATLVVDCLRCGTRESEAGNPVPRVAPAFVVLYVPMLWRAAAPS